MKKILYTTDFSPNAEKAFQFALKMAEKHHAELIMLHVFDMPPIMGHPYLMGPAEMKLQAGSSWKNYLQEFFAQFKSTIQPTFITVENTSVVKGILSIIKEHKPDLVVTGTKGKSLLKEIFIGSTTKALVQQSPVPVLAIPENAEYGNIKNVLYASDFREVDEKALRQLIEFVKPFKAEIRVLHVSTDNEYKSNEKMEWFKDYVEDSISYKHISFELLQADDIFEKLDNYVKQYDLDMMVMLKKEKHGIVEKLFHEDLVWKMEFHTSVPLLSFNEHYLRASGRKNIKRGDTIEH